jgi:hypothetical protein
MNSKTLLSLFLEKKEAGKPEFDIIGDTWQVSYVRSASGVKKDFDSPEHFYLSVIKSDKNPSYGYVNQIEWIDRVNWIEWCSSLKIKEVSITEFKEDFENAIQELKEAEKDWDEQQRIAVNEIIIPENIVRAWSIEEIKDRKNPVGPTRSKLIETTDGYFYLERHWES